MTKGQDLILNVYTPNSFASQMHEAKADTTEMGNGQI